MLDAGEAVIRVNGSDRPRDLALKVWVAMRDAKRGKSGRRVENPEAWEAAQQERMLGRSPRELGKRYGLNANQERQLRKMRPLLVLLCLLPLVARAAPPLPGSTDAEIMAGYEAWVNAQMVPDGSSRCCDISDISDGRPVEAKLSHGHWQAWVSREQFRSWTGPDGWVDVPDELVVRERNPIGFPILWVYQGVLRCFRAPAAG